MGSEGIAPLRIRIEVREGGRPGAAPAAGRITGAAGARVAVHTIELRSDGTILLDEGDLAEGERTVAGPLVRRIVSFN